MEKIIIWTVIGILYAVFKDRLKKNTAKKPGTNPTPSASAPEEKRKPSSTLQPTTKPLSDIFGEVFKPIEQRKPVTGKVAPQKREIPVVRKPSPEPATIIPVSPSPFDQPVFVHTSISDTEISEAEDRPYEQHPALRSFDLRNALIAQVILERPEW